MYELFKVREFQIDTVLGFILGLILVRLTYVEPLVCLIFGLLVFGITGYLYAKFQDLMESKSDNPKIRFIKKHSKYQTISMYFEFTLSMALLLIIKSMLVGYLTFLYVPMVFMYSLLPFYGYRCFWLYRKAVSLVQ